MSEPIGKRHARQTQRRFDDAGSTEIIHSAFGVLVDAFIGNTVAADLIRDVLMRERDKFEAWEELEGML